MTPERAITAFWLACTEDGDMDGVALKAAMLKFATPPGAQQERKPDQWAPYLKEGETHFDRFMRERSDLDALMTLYRNVLAQQERKPCHTNAEVQMLLNMCDPHYSRKAQEKVIRRILKVPA